MSSENFLFLFAQDVNHAAHLIENFFQALWYDHAHTTARSAVETDINDVRPKFRNVLKVYEVVQTAADRVVYGPDAQHAKSRAASLFANAPEIVLVVNVVGPWASVGIVTFWSILRHRTTWLGEVIWRNILMMVFVCFCYFLAPVDTCISYYIIMFSIFVFAPRVPWVPCFFEATSRLYFWRSARHPWLARNDAHGEVRCTADDRSCAFWLYRHFPAST